MKSILLVLLIIILVIVNVALMLNNRYSMKAFLISVGIFISYIFITQLICGPSPIDVYRMRLMAKPISSYIVKNGVPNSLKDIPGLPYELECDGVKEEYLAMNYINMVPTQKNKAELYNKRENCYFNNTKLSYWLQQDLKDKKSRRTISIRMFSPDETFYDFGLFENDRGQFVMSKVNIGSSKISGICNPMRQ